MTIEQGREKRDQGIAVLEAKRHEWLARARLEAMLIARRTGRVTINDVRDVIQLPPDFHPNTWGAVLRCKEFEPIGFDQARHTAAHARLVRVHKLKEN